MTIADAKVVPLATGFRHAEAPTAVGEQIWFSDVAAGGVYAYDESSGVSVTIPHRRGIGGMCVHRDGGVIVTGRNLTWKRGDRSVVLLEGRPGETFSDLCADRDGRLMAGGLFFDRTGGERVLAPGALHQVEVNASTHIVGQPTDLPNGVAFAPDDAYLYHSDTTTGVVWRYPVYGDELGPRSPLIDVGTRWPDGLAVAEDGSIWVALARGGAVSGWTADGRWIADIAVGTQIVTSVCFGGPDLNALFITTAADGDSSASGGLFRADVGVRGAALHPACVMPALV